MHSEFLKTVQKFLGLISIITAIILIGLYILFSYLLNTKDFTWTLTFFSLGKDISNALIPTLIILAVSLLLLKSLTDFFENQRDEKLIDDIARRTLEDVKPYFSNDWKTQDFFKNKNWKILFQNHKKVTVVTHYFDSWISSNEKILDAFLRKGGEIEFILPDETNTEHLTIIASRFNKSASDIKTKINNCKTKLEGIHRKANKKGVIKIIHSKKFHWNFFMLFDEKLLIISPYEGKVDVSSDSPALEFSLMKNDQVKAWILKEVQSLRS
ncbi:hypothetical protein [Acinetobacter pittii]|uniref:hypothetical protein n=1 Tax=Acinetobacter pittii TaxID=48296 RepID=UPI0013D1AD0D|nr:hypothetical protein [Acinetobacter pittii]